MSTENTHSERARKIYDDLMEHLGVPELKLDSIDTVEEQHQDESPIDRAARLEKYDAALKEAERLFGMQQLGHEINAHAFFAEQKKKLAQQESADKQEEVSDAEQQLDSFDAQ